MRSLKAEVAALADGVDFEDIQCHLYVHEKVNRGLERVEVAGAVPHEEVKKRLSKWLVG